MTENANKMDKDAIRRLIEATVVASGEPDPSTLPHQIRQKLEGRATGDIDLEQYIQQVLQEMKRA